MRHGRRIPLLAAALAALVASGAAALASEQPSRTGRVAADCVFLPAERILAIAVKRTPIPTDLEPEAAEQARREAAGEAYVVRNGESILVLGGPEAEPVACLGGTPTIRNTDFVLVRRADNVKEADLAVDMRRGLLGPGTTDERDGTSEIEVFAELGGKGTIVVATTNDPDVITVGGFEGRTAVNVNAGEGNPDPDVLSATSSFIVFGAAGGDFIDAANPRGMTPIDLPANLEGKRFGVRAIGGGGGDVLAGTAETDYLQGDGGEDFLAAGGESDIVFGLNRDTDAIDCGPGNDTFVVVDREDELTACEKRSFEDPFAGAEPTPRPVGSRPNPVTTSRAAMRSVRAAEAMLRRSASE